MMQIEARLCEYYHKTPEELDALADWGRAFRVWALSNYNPENEQSNKS